MEALVSIPAGYPQTIESMINSASSAIESKFGLVLPKNMLTIEPSTSTIQARTFSSGVAMHRSGMSVIEG